MTNWWLAQGLTSHDGLKCPACDLLPFDVLAEDRSPEPTTIDFNRLDMDRIEK